jgi:hypothetical protein
MPSAEEFFLRKHYEAKKTTKRWKKTYGANPLFIGVKGRSFKKPPRYDHCEPCRGHVSTPTFGGWRFYRNSRFVRGIGSSESTCFPEGLVLGIRQKLFTLETSDLQSSRINSWVTFGMESSASREGNIHEETLLNLIHFADLLIIRENNGRIRLLFANLLSVSGWLEIGEVQRIRNLRSSGIWWSLNSGTIVSGDFQK